jgi:cell division septal protein FtsQ
MDAEERKSEKEFQRAWEKVRRKVLWEKIFVMIAVGLLGAGLALLAWALFGEVFSLVFSLSR